MFTRTVDDEVAMASTAFGAKEEIGHVIMSSLTIVNKKAHSPLGRAIPFASLTWLQASAPPPLVGSLQACASMVHSVAGLRLVSLHSVGLTSPLTRQVFDGDEPLTFAMKYEGVDPAAGTKATISVSSDSGWTFIDSGAAIAKVI